MILDNNSLIVIKLSRLSINQDLSCTNLIPFLKETNYNWSEIYRISAKQGVLALVLDSINEAIKYYPNERRIFPAPKLLIVWQLSVELIRKNFIKQLYLIDKINTIAESNNKKYIILKGLSFAVNYPKQENRECGDIDIYFLEDADRMNLNHEWFDNVLKIQLNSKFSHNIDKHSSYILENILVENHRFLISSITKQRSHFLNKTLLTCLNEQGSVKRFTYIDNKKIEFYSGTFEFNYIQMFSHAIHHFLTENIALRHFYDFTTFISLYKNDLDFIKIRNLFKEVNLHKIYDSFLYIIVEQLNCSNKCLINTNRDSTTIERVIKETFSKDSTINNPKIPSSLFFDLKYFRFKANRFINRKWKFDLISKNEFYYYFFRTVIKKISIYF